MADNKGTVSTFSSSTFAPKKPVNLGTNSSAYNTALNKNRLRESAASADLRSMQRDEYERKLEEQAAKRKAEEENPTYISMNRFSPQDTRAAEVMAALGVYPDLMKAFILSIPRKPK